MNLRRIFLGVSLTSLSVLMLELALTRLFSATMYYHFAFMAISLALFGSGASGVFIYLLRNYFRKHVEGWLAGASALFALSTILALYVIIANPLRLWDPDNENYYRLVYIYAATSLPFFFGGSTITLTITAYAKDISRLYLFDLAGAAAGCLLMIPVLNLIGAINTVLFVAFVASAASVLFASGSTVKRAVLACSLVVAGGLGVLVTYNSLTNKIDARMAKGMELTDVLFSKWNSFSRITVEGDLSAMSAEIKIDADAATGIVHKADDLSAHQHMRDRMESLAFGIKKDASVLIIGPGGGSDVLAALVCGAKNITAVEVNPIIAQDVMSSEPFKSYSGSVYQQPGVRLVVDEGRSFIRSTDSRYDIIQATMVDTWAATAAGAFALTENNLYTVEAFKDYVTHLNDGGVLTMTRWYFEPPDQLLRLISLTRAMMTELGISNPARHIMLFRRPTEDDRSPATFIFKKSEFTDSETAIIENAAAAHNLDVLYGPSARPDNLFTKLIEAPDPSLVWRSFGTNIEPSRDNNPFFFNSIRIANLREALRGVSEWHKTNLGTFVLFLLLVITSALVVIFIIGPLALTGRRMFASDAGAKLGYVFYFACLGLGFIIVEVAMIQKFILFLGHPVYSLTVVLFSVLLFTGLGSYLSGRISDDRLGPTLLKVLGLLIVLVLVYIVALPPIFYGLVQLARPLRIIISVVLMAPLALTMGIPMPSGIRILSTRAPEIIPWAWGVNGAASVMGSVGALAIALLTGFNQALLVGASMYLLAMFFISRKSISKHQVIAVEKPVVEAVEA
jgi:spermidine synthase